MSYLTASLKCSPCYIPKPECAFNIIKWSLSLSCLVLFSLKSFLVLGLLCVFLVEIDCTLVLILALQLYNMLALGSLAKIFQSFFQ